MSDLLHETNAAGAKNTALIIERDSRADFDTFRFFDLFLEKAGTAGSKLDAVFLEVTLAGLVADRAIERMIDQKKLHDPVPAFLEPSVNRFEFPCLPQYLEHKKSAVAGSS